MHKCDGTHESIKPMILRRAFWRTCKRLTISDPPLLPLRYCDRLYGSLWAKVYVACEPQSRGCHVPGITNYAPRTIIISWTQWAHCIDTVNIWYSKHRRYSQLRCMNKVSCLRRREREGGGGERGRQRGDIWFSHIRNENIWKT